MTVDRLPDETYELRYFVDALRGALGLQPLYFIGQRTEQERFGGGEVELAGPGKPDEWFRPVAYAPDARERDKSVELQMKKLSSAGHREKLNQDRAYTWHPKTERDKTVRGYAAKYGCGTFQRKAY